MLSPHVATWVYYRKPIQHAFELFSSAARLARLWHSQGETTETNDPLAPIYGWFTERFETPNLKEANRHSLWMSYGRLRWSRKIGQVAKVYTTD